MKARKVLQFESIPPHMAHDLNISMSWVQKSMSQLEKSMEREKSKVLFRVVLETLCYAQWCLEQAKRCAFANRDQETLRQLGHLDVRLDHVNHTLEKYRIDLHILD